MSQPVVVLAYATAAIALAAQWTAAKIALGAVPPLELSTMRFAIASALLVLVTLVTRTPLPVRRWRPVTAAAASLPANRGSIGTHCISSLLAPQALEATLKAGANDAVQARSAPSRAASSTTANPLSKISSRSRSGM